MRFQEELRAIKQFREALMDTGRKNTVDNLIRATSSEMGALTYAQILTALEGIDRLIGFQIV